MRIRLIMSQTLIRLLRLFLKHISLSKEEIAKLLSQKDVSQVEFGTAGKNLSVQVKEKIEAEKLPGIKFSESPARYYPNGIFASHLIGYTDTSRGNS